MSSQSSSSSSRAKTREKGAVAFEVVLDGERKRVRIEQEEYPDLGAIEVTEPDGQEYEDRLPSLPLPGSGERYDDCGEEIPALFCPECGAVVEVGRTCRRSRCPRCWASWTFQRALTVAGKTDAQAAYEYASGTENIKQHHLTISFPDSIRFRSDQPLRRARAVGKLLLAQVNVESGVLLYHPFRIAEKYRGEVAGHDSGDGDMTWADILRLIRSDDWTWPAVRDEFLVFAPHFHVICTSPFVQGGAVTEAIEEKTGVVIHRITKPGSAVSINHEDKEDLCRVAAYSASHAGLRRTDDENWQGAITYFGDVAGRTPTPSIEQEVDETLREVAPDVLGVHFPESRCTEEVPDDEEEPAESTRERASGGAEVSGLPARPDRLTLSTASADDEEEESPWASGQNTGFSASSTWEELDGVVPAFADEPLDNREPLDDRLSRCGTRLRPMWAADRHLEDEQWTSSLPADRVAALREAYEDWVDRGRPPPDAPPSDA